MKSIFIALDTINSIRLPDYLYAITVGYLSNLNFQKTSFTFKPSFLFRSSANEIDIKAARDLNGLSPFVDIVEDLISLMEDKSVYYIDISSERILRRALEQIGYPVRKSPFIFEKYVKTHISSDKGLGIEDMFATLGFPLEYNSPNKLVECMYHSLELLQENPVASIELLQDNCNNSNTIVNVQDLLILPKTAGIYYFINDQNNILYIGKAKNIRERVRSHFTSQAPFEKKLCSQVATVNFEESGSELIALLMESKKIRKLQPIFNTQLKVQIHPYVITYKKDSKGILRLRAEKKGYQDSSVEILYNRQSALSILNNLQKKFFLCKRFAGIERATGRCSDSIFCKGICNKEENVLVYNKRVEQAFKHLQGERQSYFIKLKGRNAVEHGLVLVKQGIYVGYGFIPHSDFVNSLEDIEAYITEDTHTYYSSRIIDQFLRTYTTSKYVFELQ